METTKIMEIVIIKSFRVIAKIIIDGDRCQPDGGTVLRWDELSSGRQPNARDDPDNDNPRPRCDRTDRCRFRAANRAAAKARPSFRPVEREITLCPRRRNVAAPDFGALAAAHVAFMDWRCLRSPHNVESDGLVGVAAQAFDFEIRSFLECLR